MTWPIFLSVGTFLPKLFPPNHCIMYVTERSSLGLPETIIIIKVL